MSSAGTIHRWWLALSLLLTEGNAVAEEATIR
jgi:hypothetical protein